MEVAEHGVPQNPEPAGSSSLEYAQQLSADRPDAAGIHHSRASNDAVKLHVSMTADDRAQRPA